MIIPYKVDTNEWPISVSVYGNEFEPSKVRVTRREDVKKYSCTRDENRGELKSGFTLLKVESRVICVDFGQHLNDHKFLNCIGFNPIYGSPDLIPLGLQFDYDS